MRPVRNSPPQGPSGAQSAGAISNGVRLLIVTQAVDTADPVLGFFHRWIQELATRFERIHVVCLFEGTHALPSNVSVHSLGKERGVSRVAYVMRFLRYAWSLRHEYDAVFVHMNQEYVLLGGLLWKLLGKNVYLWRNHYAGDFLTDLAVMLASTVFCTSKSSYTAKFAKTKVMPVGVDIIPSSVARIPRSILFLARFAPSKRPDVLLQALTLLKERGVLFLASFYGSPLPHDAAFAEKARMIAQNARLEVKFYEGVPNSVTPSIYSAHDIFVNLSGSGMYDKTIFEAAAAGCLVLASSRDFAELAGPEFSFTENDARHLASKLETLMSMQGSERERARTTMRALAKQHSLKELGRRLREEIQ
ncbi:MAG TPA: glycosyltransferase [Candidatus Paceibacterota bacterium]